MTAPSPHTHPAERETPAGEAMREAVAQWLESEVGLYVSDAAEKAGEFCGPSGPIASELACLAAERDKLQRAVDAYRLPPRLYTLADMQGSIDRSDAAEERASAAEAALTTQRADHAAEVARKDEEIARLRGRKIDAFGIAIHALAAGAPGIKPPTRDAIARNFALRVRAALATTETTDA